MGDKQLRMSMMRGRAANERERTPSMKSAGPLKDKLKAFLEEGGEEEDATPAPIKTPTMKLRKQSDTQNDASEKGVEDDPAPAKTATMKIRKVSDVADSKSEVDAKQSTKPKSREKSGEVTSSGTQTKVGSKNKVGRKLWEKMKTNTFEISNDTKSFHYKREVLVVASSDDDEGNSE